MEIKIKKLSETAKIPTYGTEGAAAFDMYADESDKATVCMQAPYMYYYVAPHKNVSVPTGIAMAIPKGYVGLLFSRSGWARDESLRLANCVGVIDSDFRGNITVVVHNDSDVPRIVNPNDRIAQMLIVKYEVANLILSDELDETERGTGGFGSTGK